MDLRSAPVNTGGEEEEGGDDGC
uniref:Uncharacterized protein n=1 Tax=Arundo donax TaxID=35708 RepID=A0A0A8XQJ3_ARUDO